MTVYYNEIDPYAAEWLRNLIAAGHIAPGDVDDRSIEDVAPDDLAGYDQCHFFAGIGVWSLALRQAGWPDDRPIWTGSCPCQPFSAAGKGGGFDDERHLWPAFHWLIEQCRPSVVAGEQVAGKDGAAWLDLVSADMEGTGYAFGAVVSPAAGYGAPHIRHRTYWLADADNPRPQGWGGVSECAAEQSARAGGVVGGLEHGTSDGRLERWSQPGGRGFGGGCGIIGLADSNRGQRDGRAEAPGRNDRDRQDAGRAESDRGVAGRGGAERPGPTNGYWRDADWLGCRDGKWRPVEPGTFPLAHGAAARVGRLRAYGNAIVAPQAAEFIRAYLEARVDESIF
jgi:DNA (cytosine-5)-methyltransferase 1